MTAAAAHAAFRGSRLALELIDTANTLACVAMECRVLQVDASDRYTWNRKAAERYDVVRFGFSKPAIFMPIDGLNRDELGLGGTLQPLGSYRPTWPTTLTSSS